MKKIKFLIIASGLFWLSGAVAQSTSSISRVTPFTGVKDYRTWSFGISGGMSSVATPFGSPYEYANIDAGNVGFVYGINIKKQIFHGFGLQADFMRGVVKGTKKNRQIPTSFNGGFEASAFKTNIDLAASLSGVFTLGTVNWLNRQATVLPYIAAGVGYMAYHTQLAPNKNGEYRYLSDFANVTSSKPDASKDFYLPLGFGLKFNVASGVNIDLGYHYYLVNSNHFNGIDATGKKDKFSSLKLGVELALGNKRKPQLAVVNPAAQLAMDLWDRNQDFKNKLEVSNQKYTNQIQDLQQQINDLQKDTDNDGVADIHDKCPETQTGMRVDGAGCPIPQPKQIIKQEKIVVTQQDRKIVDEAIKNLEFDLGKATIRPISFASLNSVAVLLINKDFSLKLSGHTDNTGNDALNMRLSKERAEAVKTYLVSRGANPSRIEAVGYGSMQPIASNDTAEGRQKNRRVEFTLY